MTTPTKLSGPIQFKRSITPGVVPSPEQLLDGQPYTNLADRKVFLKGADGQVFEVGGPSNRHTSGPNPHANPILGDTWTPPGDRTVLTRVAHSGRHLWL